MNDYIKELDGELLIVTEDDRTYTLGRSAWAGQVVITPDSNTTPCTMDERVRFMEHWNNSGAKNR